MTQALAKEKDHALLSASSSKRWFVCPGSIALAKKVPPELKQRSSIWADEGTAAHGLMEECLLKGVWRAKKFLNRKIVVNHSGERTTVSMLKKGKEFKASDNGFIVTDDMADSVQVMLDHVQDELVRLGPKAKMQVETRVYPIEGRDDLYGTADVTISTKKEIVVIDYKHGAGVVVDIKGNTQARYYALGVARLKKYRQKKIKMTVVQPRAAHPDGVVRSEKITMDELLEWRNVLIKAIKRTTKPDAKLKAGEHCQFCEAEPICSEKRKFVQDAAAMDFDDEDSQPRAVGEDPHEIAKMLKIAPQIESWLKSIYGAAQAMAERGTKFEGRKLVRKNTHRAYLKNLSDKKVLRYLEKLGYDPEAAMSEPKLKTPAQVEKLLKPKDRRKFNNKFVVKPEGELVLVDAGDAREEVDYYAGSDFEKSGGDAEWDG